MGLELLEVVLNFRVCVSLFLSLSSLSIGLSLFTFISSKVVRRMVTRRLNKEEQSRRKERETDR